MGMIDPELLGENPDDLCDLKPLDINCPECDSGNYWMNVSGYVLATLYTPEEWYGTEICFDCGYREEVG